MDDADPMAIPPFLRRTPATEPTQKETDMARPKGSKNKPKVDAPDPANDTNGAPAEAAASIGHNSKKPADLTDEERQALALQWMKKFEASLAAKNKASSEHSNLCKRLKTEMGDDGVDTVKDMIAMRTPEGEAKIRAAMERQARAARWMAAPLGSQFDFFEDRMPAEDRAYAEGKRDAMSGEPLVNAYDPSVPQHNRYAEGWHDGQRAMVEAQRARDAEVFDDVGPEEAAALADIEKNGIAGAIGTAAPTYETAH